MVLVDTSVLVDYLRRGNGTLRDLLNDGRVCIHPMVIGELACGNLRNRAQLMECWQNLPVLLEVSHKEALFFLESHALTGRGIGYIDLHLLASILLSGHSKLWTRDKRLASVADALDVMFAMR